MPPVHKLRAGKWVGDRGGYDSTRIRVRRGGVEIKCDGARKGERSNRDLSQHEQAVLDVIEVMGRCLN
jgi:hypothetical protein